MHKKNTWIQGQRTAYYDFGAELMSSDLCDTVCKQTVAKLRESPAERNARIFAIYDINKNGKLTAIELRIGAVEMGTSPEQLNTVAEEQVRHQSY